MIKASPTAEPEVEDLLASIRKAITDEAGVPSSHQVPVISGSMRELRVRTQETPEGGLRAGEIHELRNKISTQLGRKEPRSPEPERPMPVAPNGFAGILGGDTSMLAKQPSTQLRQAAEPLPLRESLARLEAASEQIQAASQARGGTPYGHDERRYEEPSWQDPPPRYPPLADWRGSRSDPQAEMGMMSQDSAAAASSAFNRLAESLMARATGERPIEEITRELLRSMLKQWLDEHLPALVERMVREEIERVARRGPLR